MRTHVRLRDRRTDASYIVDMASGKVYSDENGRGSISHANQVHDVPVDRVLASAREYDHFFEPIPGNTTPDGKFEVRGALTRSEHDAFSAGRSVPSVRPALLLHLDFFDCDLDGRISFAENYAGWRRLGFPRFAACWKALLSALVFGRVGAGLAIQVDRLDDKRYASGTGIYDGTGRIDQARLEQYLAAFDADGGALGFGDAIALLNANSAKGIVSRTQFRSLFQVCERLNRGQKLITRTQFRGLFDGSLLWLAASTPGRA